MASQKHFVERSKRAVEGMQAQGLVDSRLDPGFVSDALGAMMGRFAELWLTQDYAEYDFDVAVEQITMIWANALGLPPEPKPAAARSRGRRNGTKIA